MAGRVDHVQIVGDAVLRRIGQAHGLCLDRDAALALNIHAVEHLRVHLTRGQAAAILDQPVGKGRLPVIDMGDDREISDVG